MFVLAFIFFILFLFMLLGSKAARVKVDNPDYDAYSASGRANPRYIQKDMGGQVRRLSLVPLTLSLLFLAFTVVYTTDTGQAKYIKNWGGTLERVDTTAGFETKLPWQTTEEFDLRSRTATFAGGDTPPSYTNGNVQGREITVSLGRVQPNVDLQLTYSVQPNEEKLRGIYNEFRSSDGTQENFTQQIIQPAILAAARQAPSLVEVEEDPLAAELENQAPGVMTPTQFRGDYRDEVSDQIVQTLNEEFEKYGVVVARANLQDIRFRSQVEDSLTAVEVAQQREQEAQANLRATEIEAQAQVVQAEQEAEATIARATGEAEANRLISASLTPQVLQQRQIEAMQEGTIYVVPQGTQPLVSVGP